MAGIRTCDRESHVQRPNHYTTEPPVTVCAQSGRRLHGHMRVVLRINFIYHKTGKHTRTLLYKPPVGSDVQLAFKGGYGKMLGKNFLGLFCIELCSGKFSREAQFFTTINIARRNVPVMSYRMSGRGDSGKKFRGGNFFTGGELIFTGNVRNNVERGFSGVHVRIAIHDHVRCLSGE